MSVKNQRLELRALLSATDCQPMASVYDPLSARLAARAGFQISMLAGSVASFTTLAAPDLILMSLSEVSDQVRRITRAGSLPLVVDADHGFGNALNVMRTVQELEHAGVSALTIEDTALPIAYGQPEGNERVVSLEEGVGKMRAALNARSNPELVVAARTSAVRIESLEQAIARGKAYAAVGVDAIFLGGIDKIQQLSTFYAAVKLPIMLPSIPPSASREALAKSGVRVIGLGHQPLAAAVHALQETYASQIKSEPLNVQIVSKDVMNSLTDEKRYQELQRQYMR